MAKCLACIHWKACFSGKEWDAAIGTPCEYFRATHVEPFVLCKDCEHWMKDVPGCTDFVGRCDLANYMVGVTGYCVYGERRG